MALCAVYNFIRRHEASSDSDADELSDLNDNQHDEDDNQCNEDDNQRNEDGNQCNEDNEMDDHAPAVNAVGARDRSWQLCEDIASAMWVDYQTLLVQRAGGDADDHISDSSNDM